MTRIVSKKHFKITIVSGTCTGTLVQVPTIFVRAVRAVRDYLKKSFPKKKRKKIRLSKQCSLRRQESERAGRKIVRHPLRRPSHSTSVREKVVTTVQAYAAKPRTTFLYRYTRWSATGNVFDFEVIRSRSRGHVNPAGVNVTALVETELMLQRGVLFSSCRGADFQGGNKRIFFEF